MTAAQIAAAVGVTERTFFRYFPDKREVLFGDETMVRDAVVAGIRDAPGDLGPLDMLFHAHRAFGPVVEARRDYAAPRQALIDAHPALRERELAKIDALAEAVAVAFEARGVEAARVALAARIGMVAIAQATGRWLADDAIPLEARLREVRLMQSEIAA